MQTGQLLAICSPRGHAYLNWCAMGAELDELDVISLEMPRARITFAEEMSLSMARVIMALTVEAGTWRGGRKYDRKAIGIIKRAIEETQLAYAN